MGRRTPHDGRQIKGFRPGKEPPELRRRQARERLGPDASWAQKQMIDVIGERRPEEVSAMMRKWTLALVALGLVLAGGGFFLYGWSTAAGVVVHAVAAGVLFLAFRVNRQGRTWVDAAESWHQPRKSRGRGRKKRS